MRGYKALTTDLTAKNGFRYELGREYQIKGKLEICKNGFHFCQNVIDVFAYYNFNKYKIVVCEVEANGEIIQEGTKYCAEKIKLIRRLDWEEVSKVINFGICNVRSNNSGDYNSGNYNFGNFNSGSYNSGNYNVGDYNSGSCNSGNHNSGSFNTGTGNSGHSNSGSYNSGFSNSGRCNFGNCNSGNYNYGNHNSGFFNSNEPTVRLFNKDSGLTYDEFYNFRIDFDNLENSKEAIKSLPNYDAEIFLQCTGIDWREEK